MLNERKKICAWEELPKDELFEVQGGERKASNLVDQIVEFITVLLNGNKENNN